MNININWGNSDIVDEYIIKEYWVNVTIPTAQYGNIYTYR